MIADLFPRIPKDEVAELESKIKQTASYKGFTQLTDRETREVIEQTYSYHLGIPDKAFHPLADAMWKKGQEKLPGVSSKNRVRVLRQSRRHGSSEGRLRAAPGEPVRDSTDRQPGGALYLGNRPRGHRSREGAA